MTLLVFLPNILSHVIDHKVYLSYFSLLIEQGRVSNALIHVTDWLPTLVSAAGGSAEKLGDIDGVDQWEILANDHISSNRELMLYNIDNITGVAAVR